MSLILVLVSTLMISDNVEVVSGSISWREFWNTQLDREMIIEGSKAEERYLMEQENQTKELEELTQQHLALVHKINSGRASLSERNEEKLNSYKPKAYRLNQKERELDFCDEENLCERAFKNSFFSKQGFTQNWQAGSLTECDYKRIIARKGGEPIISTVRQLVQCDITSTTGITKVFLAPSTKYNREENLKFFVLIPEKGKAKPIAYLMNKKEPKPKINEPEILTLIDLQKKYAGYRYRIFHRISESTVKLRPSNI